MNRLYFVAGLALVASSPLHGGHPKLPAGPIPQLGLGVIREDGNLEIKHALIKDVWETRTRMAVSPATPANPTGPAQEVRTITERVVHHVREERLKQIGPGQYWVFQDGKLLDATAAAKLLNRSTPVVFAQFEKPKERFDPFYLQFFKPGTVIVGFALP